MRPIFILSFVPGAYAVGDNFPFNPVPEGLAQTLIKYSEQSTAGKPWKDATTDGVCSTGSNQSPIDIVTASATIPTNDPGMPMINNLNPKQSYSINIGNRDKAAVALANDLETADGTGLTIFQTTRGDWYRRLWRSNSDGWTFRCRRQLQLRLRRVQV